MNVKNISREEFISLLDRGQRFKLVDVLSREHFANEHIRGAISLPVDRIEKFASEVLPHKDEKIVVYCASFECQASTNAAKKLLELGYADVLDYKGGLKDYKQTGRQLEGALYEKAQKTQEASSSCCAS